MTPHLHPRSRLTTSLFGTTLLVSFLVVGMPHVIPCPAPRVKFTEGDYYVTEDGRRIRRRRPQAAKDSCADGQEEDLLAFKAAKDVQNVKRKKAHECPVPKPRGLLGEVLGFGREGSDEKQPRPRIETSEIPGSRREAS